MDLSDSSTGRAWPSRAACWPAQVTDQGLPCCVAFLLRRAVALTPAGPPSGIMGHSPVRGDCGLPLQGRRVGSCETRFRGLLGVHVSYGLPARGVARATLSTGGFGRIVTSPTAPIATGWNDSCRVGIAPTEDQRLGTAHTGTDSWHRFPADPSEDMAIPVQNGRRIGPLSGQ